MQQAHELKFLAAQSVAKSAEIKQAKVNLAEETKTELKALEDPHRTFASFDESFQQIIEKSQGLQDQPTDSFAALYLMYSSTPKDEWVMMSSTSKKTKRKHIASEGTSHIQLNSIFAYEEGFGRYLDLREFYGWYRESVNPETSYTEYLSLWWIFPYKMKENKNSSYSVYLHDIHRYLVGFLKRTHPLENECEEITADKEPAPKRDDEGKFFCGPCKKWFAKESVYVGHLGGKKHVLNRNKSTIQQIEASINQLATKHLNEERMATITHNERLPLMTDREKELERINNEGYGSEYTTVDDDSDFEAKDMQPSDIEDDEDDTNGKDLPLGPDGRPMPFWLYRLQGLHRSFECEICGNVSYKGRLVFEKHFNSTKHQQGLKLLGVSEDYLLLFKSFTLISEANELWGRIKKEKRAKDEELENAVEVEDNEGNVMSSKDYHDLKRQGLL